MIRRLETTWQLIRDTYLEWRADRAHRLAAALAFYTAFSLAPLLVIGIAVAGALFGQEAVRGEIVGQARGLIGDQGARAVEALVRNARRPGSGVLPSIMGVAALIFAALGVFNMLQDAMNTLWNVKGMRRNWWKSFLVDRAVSFAMMLATGFLLLVSLLVSAGVSAARHVAQGYLPAWLDLLGWVNVALDLTVVTVLFAFIFRFVPDTEVAWKDVWWGAALTSIFFTAGKLGIGLYLGNSSIASSYGAAGSLAVILIWVYYSAQILFFGAEFSQVYAHRCGSRKGMKPKILSTGGPGRSLRG